MKNKILSKKNFKYYIVGIASLMIIVPTTLLVVSLTTNKRDFILANYQSYMSKDVEEKLNKKYGINFDYFENIEGAKKFLTSNTADIVCTTPYEAKKWAHEGLIEKIDLTKLGIDDQTYISGVKEILDHYKINNETLFNYGVPYFAQELVFCYRGEEIKELSGSVTWKDILNIISSNDRFKPKNNKPNIMMLDDKRTIYSIPRSIQSNQKTINPDNRSSISTLSDTYSIMSNYLLKLGKNSIKLNSDANAVLNSLAEGSVNGGIMFSGDAIYASYGGDTISHNGNEEDVNKIINDTHIVKATDSLMTVDILVINKKTSNSIKNKIYDVINSLCIEFNQNSDPESYLTYQNFDFMNYTPSIKSLYDYVTTQSGYFDNNKEAANAIKFNDAVSSNRLEENIDELTKSNMDFAWINFRNKFGV